MVKEAILEKVKKLMELQKGAEAIDSMEEAANAADKVRRLLLKYNLEMADVHALEDEDPLGRHDQKDISPKKNEGQWIFALYTALAKYNLCTTIKIQMSRDALNSYLSIVGMKENVEVVKYLGEQLDVRIRIMEKEAWSNKSPYVIEKRNTFRRGYFIGAVQGIGSQLREREEAQMESEEAVNALVLVNKEQLREAVSKNFGPTRKAKRSSLKGSQGNSMGYKDGKSMNINQEKQIS